MREKLSSATSVAGKTEGGRHTACCSPTHCVLPSDYQPAGLSAACSAEEGPGGPRPCLGRCDRENGCLGNGPMSQVLTLSQGLVEQAWSSPLSRTKQASGDPRPVFLCPHLHVGSQPVCRSPGTQPAHYTPFIPLWEGRASQHLQHKAQLRCWQSLPLSGFSCPMP